MAAKTITVAINNKSARLTLRSLNATTSLLHIQIIARMVPKTKRAPNKIQNSIGLIVSFLLLCYAAFADDRGSAPSKMTPTRFITSLNGGISITG